MFNMQLSAEQRLQKAVSAILHDDRYKPLAGILMMGERGVKDDIPTACTNGRDEWYGRDFIATLSDAELRFVVVHEAFHKMYRHLITWKHLADKCRVTANYAMDYVINLKISDDNKDGFCKIPKTPDGRVNGLLDERFRDMDTAQVFNIIYEENGGKGDKGDGGGFDDHDWDGAKEMTADEVRELEQEIDTAVRQGALLAGKMNLDASRTLGELLEVQVDWREVLRDFITTTCSGKDYSTWRRPNRRFMGAGVYMPSAISERVDELLIAVDTSGSIGQVELTSFLTEVVGICMVVKPERIRLWYWGTEVVQEELYEHGEYDNLIRQTKPKGGGGTDVECVPAMMLERKVTPQAVICLTDGCLYGGWGQWNCPVLWTIMDNKGATPTCGKTVHIKSSTL